MKDKLYQKNYSEVYSHKIDYDRSRDIKAHKTMKVISDFSSTELRDLRVLEIGCYKGEISYILSEYFKEYVAIDIDEKAIKIANERFNRNNLKYRVDNADSLSFDDSSFDIVICSHVYEHVPFPNKMMTEIYRVLKFGGFCYFAAGNKLKLIEPHYRLPFLSWLPKKIAHLYLNITNKGDHYYENLFTYPKLKKLVKRFKVNDYTLDILKHPDKFNAGDLLKKDSNKQKLSIFVYKYFKIFFPTFIWILEKK